MYRLGLTKMVNKIILMFAVIVSIQGCAGWAQWRLFDMSDMRYYYYDAGSIERPSENIVKVKLSSVVKGDGGRNWEMNERLMRGLAIEGYGNYESSEDIYEIDCKKKMFKVLSGADYDNEGKVLGSYSNPSPGWKHIPEESAIETLYQYRTICPLEGSE